MVEDDAAAGMSQDCDPEAALQHRWRARCYGMARATYALADLSEDRHMIQDYVDLAARWVMLADRPPPPGFSLTS